jgi:hypothetical protein
VIVQSSKEVKSMKSNELYDFLAKLSFGNDDVDYTVNKIPGEQIFYQ